MRDDDEYLLLSTLLHELREEFAPKRPSYQKLWLAIVEGTVPAIRDRNKWWIKRGDKPIAAQALGLTPRTPTAA